MNVTNMEQREIDIIAKDLWKDELRFRKDPKNTHIVKWEKELFEELNALGYDFHWSVQFGFNTFTEKDKEIIPIIIKHLDKTENCNIKADYMSCLGVRGFYDATKYVLNEYETNLITDNEGIRNVAAQVIERIQDPGYVDKYLSFLTEDKLTPETAHIIRLLSKMKIEKAIPYFINLLSKENKIKSSYYGTVLEYCKYRVSQESINALAQFKNPEHIKYVEKFLTPEKLSWIQYPDTTDGCALLKSTYTEYRNIAKKAIKKMGGGPNI